LAGTAFGQFSFSGPDAYATPLRPAGVAVGDFDGVNGADLAVVTNNPDKVSLLFNTGVGTFTGPVDILTGGGTGPGHIVSLDANGDGIVDLAVALQNSNAVMVLQGNGVGGFATLGSFPVGADPRYLVARDFNDDGMMDIASANRDGNSVTVLLNSGAGFVGTSFAVGDEPRALTAGDFNNDGMMDIAASNHRDRNVSLLAGNGAGGFTPMGTLAVNPATRPDGLVAADLDGDGDDDLAVATGGPDFVSVFLNTGGLGARIDYPTGGVGLSGLAAGDLDGDGDMDLVGLNKDTNSMSLLANNGNGTFGAAQLMATGTSPDHAVVADLGGSTAMDIAVTNRDSDNTMVFLNNAIDDCDADFNGDGTADTQDVLAFLNAWTAGDPSADVNEDGSVDTLDVLVFLNAWNAGC